MFLQHDFMPKVLISTNSEWECEHLSAVNDGSSYLRGCLPRVPLYLTVRHLARDARRLPPDFQESRETYSGLSAHYGHHLAGTLHHMASNEPQLAKSRWEQCNMSGRCTGHLRRGTSGLLAWSHWPRWPGAVGSVVELPVVEIHLR